MIDGCILAKTRQHGDRRYPPDMLVVAETGRGRLPVALGHICTLCSQSYRAGMIPDHIIENAVQNGHVDAILEAEGGVQPNGARLGGVTQIVTRESRCSRCTAPLDPKPYYMGSMCPSCTASAPLFADRAASPHDKLSEMLALAKLMRADAAETTSATTPTLPPQETSMSTTQPTTTPPAHPVLQTLQTDATDAAWRTAGSQFVKLARDPLAAVLCRHLGPDDPAFRARVAAFLQTELGASILSAVLSAGLSALPQASGPVPDRLARELRVRSMSGIGDTLADVLMGPLREVA